MPLPNYIPCIVGGEESNNRKSFIVQYFNQGCSNFDILGFLLLHHNIQISLSTLKRDLVALGLSRRHLATAENPNEIRQLIEEELAGSGVNLGYRKIWKIIQSKGIPAKRQTVMEILREVDPEGVQARKKKRLRRRIYSVPGPDHLWHIDGYDKLKPYGFSIHGCIDGFSRRLIWLEVCPSNKNPRVIAKFFIDAAKQLRGIPLRIRCDDGTENSIIEPIQVALRSADDDEFSGEGSFLIGTSPANQRIECFWSQFNKERPMWWRFFFKDLSDNGLLDIAVPAVAECVRYCFMDILRAELTDVALRWNQHIISPSQNVSLPRGRPDSLYFLPQLYESRSYRKEINIDELSVFEDPEVIIQPEDNSPEFLEFVSQVVELKGIENFSKPKTTKDALELYFILLELIQEFM